MSTRALPQFLGEVELRPSFAPRPRITHVVFDFDGTLSWVRHGWPELMFSVFRKYLPPVVGEAAETTQALLDGIVFGMNGRPSIVQMQRFSEVVIERGGPQLEAGALREEFQDRLDADIAERLELIRSGEALEDAFVVHAARPLLERLRSAGLTLVILSSTVEHRVKEEAEALGLTEYFGRHIYGSPLDPRGFSKRDVFERLLREEGATAENLLSFGDGPVEIVATKELGGLAIAVCSDEHVNGSGVMDAFKRRQLLEAGADAAIPDYRDAIALVEHLRST
jgi:FMN phosphatase YigB (HAD superfamily)